MTVAAVEAAPAAAGAGAGAGSGAGSGAAAGESGGAGGGGQGGGGAGQMLGGGGGGGQGGAAQHVPGLQQARSKGVLMAIAIVLLWLAGLAFFIALEGSKLLAEQATPDGGGFMKALVQGLGRIVQTQANGGDSNAGG